MANRELRPAVALAAASVLTAGWLALGCCQRSAPGVIADASPDSSFAPGDTQIYLFCGQYGADGLCRINLDGSGLQLLVPASYYLHDITDDGAWLLLGDQDTNLYIARGDGTDIREIPQLAGRTGEAAFSPDGETIAAVRHADFDRPQHQWVDDDMLVLIDVETTATKVIPASVNDMVVNVRWTTGGTGVFLDLQNLSDQLVVPATGTRAVAVSSPSMRLSPRFDGSTHCAATGDQVEAVGWEGDGGLVLVSASGQETALVTVAGRERGFHDHFATVDRFYFTDDCEYVVFDFDESVWVAEVSSGRVGPITPGRESFQAP